LNWQIFTPDNKILSGVDRWKTIGQFAKDAAESRAVDGARYKRTKKDEMTMMPRALRNSRKTPMGSLQYTTKKKA